ncbi:MAG: hypothetical protein Q9172_001240 [Xanthocarpia lactea]
MSYSGLLYVTSIITYVTRYLDTTITEIREVKTATNTTYITSTDVAPIYPGIPVDNKAPGRPKSVVSELNGTVVTIAGTTVQSPQAFFVFSTVKIIKVLAVTDENGYHACTTTSTNSIKCGRTPEAGNLFPGINTHVEEYFEGNGGPTTPPVPAPTPILNHTVVSFSNPFVYTPIRFASAASIDGLDDLVLSSRKKSRNKRALAPATTFTDVYDGAPEDYGYIPQALIDWAVQNDKHRGLASCLPGGPRIEPPSPCSVGIMGGPAFEKHVPDLTLSSAVTVDGDGCFNPVGCPNAKLSSLGLGNEAAPSVSAAPTTVESVGLAEPTASLLFSKLSQTGTPRSSAAAAIVAAPGEKPNPDVASRTTTSAVQVQTQSQPQAPRQDQAPGKGSSTVGANTNSRFADVVVSSSPSSYSPLALPPNQQVEVQAGSQTLTPIIQSSSIYYVLDSATLTPDGPSLTISGNTYFVPVSATALVVNDAATPIQSPGYSPSDIASLIMGAFGPSNAPPGSPENVDVGTPSVVDNWDHPEFEGTTHLQDQPGTTYSLPATLRGVYVNGLLSPLPEATAGAPLVIGDLTLTPGAAPITISGTAYYLSSTPSPTAILVNGSPSPLPFKDTTAVQPGLVLGTQSLRVGSAITVSGVEISLPTGEIGEIVVGGTTRELPQLTESGKEVPLTVGAGIVTATLGFLTSSVAANNREKGNQSAATGVEGGRIINSSGVGNGGNGTGAYTGPEFVGTASRSLGSWDSLQIIILAGIASLLMLI